MDDSRNSLAEGARGELAMIGAQRPAPHLTRRPGNAFRPAPRRHRRVAFAGAAFALLGLLAFPSSASAQTTITGWFASIPGTHNGAADFTVRISFSEGITISDWDFRTYAVTVTGGHVHLARKIRGRADRWELAIRPGSGADVTIVLQGLRACDLPGAICTRANKQLASTLNGTVNGPGNAPPTASDGRVTVIENMDYTFTAADFNYADGDGDPLASVTIAYRPTAGALKLGAADVGLDDVVTKAQLDAGSLTYTPPTGETGTDLAFFAFSVNDGTTESRAVYRMNIDIAADTVAPGPPRNLTAVPGNGAVALSWEAPLNPGGSAIVRYEVRHAAGGAVPPATAWESAGRDLMHSVAGLTNGRPHAFEVRAVNSSTPSESSAAPVRATPLASLTPSVSMEGVELRVAEDAGTAVVNVSLDRPSTAALTVPWKTADDTAVSPDDYIGGEGSVTFAPGETRNTISVRIVDDALREDVDVYGRHERFWVLPSRGDGYRLENDGEALPVVIEDNDGDGPVTGDTQPPLLTQAAVNGNMLVLTYNKALDGASVPAPGAFAVTAAGGAITVTGVSITGSTVTLTLATAVEAGQTVTLAYTPGTNPIQDAADNDASPLSGRTVTNNTGGGTVSPPPPPPPPPTGGGGGGTRGPSQTVPGAPTNLLADGGDEQVTLSWQAPENDGGLAITDYEVRINGRGSWISMGSTQTTHAVTGLVNGTVYVFQVRAVNRIGRSRASLPAEATPRAAVALDFAHFANGAGIVSDLVFVNVATHPIRPVLYFYDQEGHPMDPESVVDLTEDLEVTEDGALTVRTAMEPLGELTVSTHGRGKLVSGSVAVAAKGPIGGVLRFDLPDIGVAGVGSSPPVRDALFPARRQAGGIRTAAALHNLGEEAITVSCRLMSGGRVLEAVEIDLEANGQEARYIEELFTATDTSDFVGSVRCTAPDLFTGIAVELDAGNRIFTTLPVVPVARAGGGGQETVLYFAHFANGGGTTSDLVFVNVSPRPSGPGPTPYHAAVSPSRPALYFYDQEGNLMDPASVVDLTGDLEVTGDGALSIQTEMEPLGELTISTHGRGELVSGSVTVVSEGPIGGVLRYALPGIGVTGVGASPPVRDALFPVRQEGGLATAAALRNLTGSDLVVTCRLMKDGAVLEETQIPLAANGQEARYIEEMFTFTGADRSDFVGSVRCTVPPGEAMFTGVAVELDAANRIFTTLPVVPVQRAADSQE